MHGPVNKLLRVTADIKMAGSGHPHSSPLNGDFEEEKHALECTGGNVFCCYQRRVQARTAD